MSSCKIDHTIEDVTNKLASQHPFLPEDIYLICARVLERKPNQSLLNELFHLLKKYDLASDEEKQARHEKMAMLS